MGKTRKGFEFIAEIPKEEGGIYLSLSSFGDDIIVVTPLAPPRFLKRREDGTHYLETIGIK